MPRIPVPDDYEGDTVTVAGADDYHYGQADVNLEGVDSARNLQIRADEDGRYCGAGGAVADAVREYLGVTDSDSGDEDSSGDDSDAEPREVTDDATPVVTEASDEDERTPQTITEAIDNGECPWCDEYDGDHVGQHASSAHPDEWNDYTEATE